MNRKILLFDLDGTLLTSEKKISDATLKALKKCRENGHLIGVATSRSASNSQKYIDPVAPEIVISNAGALVTVNGKNVVCEAFTGVETSRIIRAIRQICGEVSLTADTACGKHYRNYIPEQDALEASWGESIFDDLSDFSKDSLKICAAIFDDEKAEQLKASLPECDCIRFTDGYWYKFTKAGINKEAAIVKLCESIASSPQDIIAFGDDLADIGMLKLCGIGVAMGNAADEVKNAADVVIGTNDEDGIAEYLIKMLN